MVCLSLPEKCDNVTPRLNAASDVRYRSCSGQMTADFSDAQGPVFELP
jgi:hypothetical protein